MIFLTGGLGYIGSHIAAKLAEQEQHTDIIRNGQTVFGDPSLARELDLDKCLGLEIVILDNLCNSNIFSLTTLRHIYPTTTFHFYEGDVRDAALLRHIFDSHPIHVVIHLAALKSVKESFAQQTEYESVNVGGTETLLAAMESSGCTRIVFSSSATVYGTAPSPLSESSKAGVGIANPYGETKWTVEQLLKARAPTIQSVILRYFNPVGASPTHLLGEAPTGTPNNLFPVLLRSLKNQESITVFGSDWPTRDGTCIRDYIDIQDLATAHTAAVKRFDSLVASENPWIANVGTGNGTTILELFAAFEEATGIPVPYTLGDRREGDLSEVVAAISPSRLSQLAWAPVHTLEKSCRNAWRFSEYLESQQYQQSQQSS